MELSWLEFAGRLAIALLLGTTLGLERQWRHRFAGLQTNTLVSLGSALFVMIGVMTPSDDSPTRIVAQVVSGIGFLAGGVILKEGATVHGLNTAATLWCAAAVGALVGGGFEIQAAMGTAMVLLVNTVLRPISYRINQQPLHGSDLSWCYICSVVCESSQETHVRALIIQSLAIDHVHLRSLTSHETSENPRKLKVEAEMLIKERNDSFIEHLISYLSLESGVASATWRISEFRN